MSTRDFGAKTDHRQWVVEFIANRTEFDDNKCEVARIFHLPHKCVVCGRRQANNQQLLQCKTSDIHTTLYFAHFLTSIMQPRRRNMQLKHEFEVNFNKIRPIIYFLTDHVLFNVFSRVCSVGVGWEGAPSPEVAVGKEQSVRRSLQTSGSWEGRTNSDGGGGGGGMVGMAWNFNGRLFFSQQ